MYLIIVFNVLQSLLGSAASSPQPDVCFAVLHTICNSVRDVI